MCQTKGVLATKAIAETESIVGDSQGNTRLESGFKVVARYADERDHPRPLGVFDHTIEGLKEAIGYASKVAEDLHERILLNKECQVDSERFDVIVYEFESQVRELCYHSVIDGMGIPAMME
jgi:hypothetical protein